MDSKNKSVLAAAPKPIFPVGQIYRVSGNLNGILVPGGFGDRGTEGKVIASKYARENNLPYFGLCLGMQIAVIDFARNVLGLEKANSEEFDSDTPDPVIHIMDDQKSIEDCLLYTSPSPRDRTRSRMPSSA